MPPRRDRRPGAGIRAWTLRPLLALQSLRRTSHKHLAKAAVEELIRNDVLAGDDMLRRSGSGDDGGSVVTSGVVIVGDPKPSERRGDTEGGDSVDAAFDGSFDASFDTAFSDGGDGGGGDAGD